MLTDAIVMTAPGGPEVLGPLQRAVSAPGPGEVLLRQQAVGVNFIDVQHRTGRYPLPEYPVVIGVEAAGTVEAVGEGVVGFVEGDRAAYASLPAGAYCGLRCVPADRLVPLPAGLPATLAAAVLLKGFTAHYLVHDSHPVRRGDTVLVHAAAGGVGLLLCQWARRLGARVIGVVGSAAKVAFAQAHGCAAVIDARRDDVAAEVARLTEGAGVDAVYDSIGGAMFAVSLACLKPRGTLVSYGTAAGPVPPFDIFELNRRGSLRLTSPSVFTHTRDTAEMRMRARALFGAILDDGLRVLPPTTLPLAEAAAAHRALGERSTTGSTVLLP